MHDIDLPPYVSKRVLVKHAVPPGAGAGCGLSVVNCALHSGEELEEGDREVEERGWLIGEGSRNFVRTLGRRPNIGALRHIISLASYPLYDVNVVISLAFDLN